jgi:flavin-binding protein dodecin
MDDTEQGRTSLRQKVRELDALVDAQGATIRELEWARDKLAEESLVFQGAHAREKSARESWVQAYREALARAEKAEQALDAAMAAVRENAEGMDACVTAGPQCHYELPYEACKRLLAVLKSDALQHRHTYAPDTGKCSCGHAEADDSR